MAPLLERAGHTVYRPTLTGLGERVHHGGADVNLSTHIADVANVCQCEDLHDVVLVGHSYAGMVITAVAAQVASRVAHLVYRDAFGAG